MTVYHIGKILAGISMSFHLVVRFEDLALTLAAITANADVHPIGFSLLHHSTDSRLTIALFKAKPTTSSKELDQFLQAGKLMLGKVPGLLAIEFGKALEMFKAYGNGFDLGAVVTLSKPEDFGAYTNHPLHHEYASPSRSHLACLIKHSSSTCSLLTRPTQIDGTKG